MDEREDGARCVQRVNPSLYKTHMHAPDNAQHAHTHTHTYALRAPGRHPPKRKNSQHTLGAPPPSTFFPHFISLFNPPAPSAGRGRA